MIQLAKLVVLHPVQTLEIVPKSNTKHSSFFVRTNELVSASKILVSDVDIDTKSRVTIFVINKILSKKDAEIVLDFISKNKENIAIVFFKKIEKHCLSILKNKAEPNEVPCLMFKKW